MRIRADGLQPARVGALDRAPPRVPAVRHPPAEVLAAPARSESTARATKAIELLGVVAIPIDETAPPRLAELRAGTKPDCCVLLAAQDSGASTVLTFDDRLLSEAQRLGFATG